jgi:DMSO reductase anchor subunit
VTDALPKLDPRWRVRRRVVVATLLYCAALVLWLAAFAADTPLRQQIAIALVGLAGATIGSYVFGAVWDDKR